MAISCLTSAGNDKPWGERVLNVDSTLSTCGESIPDHQHQEKVFRANGPEFCANLTIPHDILPSQLLRRGLVIRGEKDDQSAGTAFRHQGWGG